MNKIIRCYNCGKLLKKGEITKEHIPARTLFEGFDSEHKVNRITVYACFNCNHHYSPTDEEFRNLIGVISKHYDNYSITDKAVKSITKNSGFDRLCCDSLGKVIGVSFKQQTIEDFHKKNFKGLFYFQYGLPLPQNYELLVNIDENDFSQSTLSVLNYLQRFFKSKYSGHPNILSFCLQPLREIKRNPDKKDLDYKDNENIYACLLTYNQEHTALVYAIKTDYLTKIKHIKSLIL